MSEQKMTEIIHSELRFESVLGCLVWNEHYPGVVDENVDL